MRKIIHELHFFLIYVFLCVHVFSADGSSQVLELFSPLFFRNVFNSRGITGVHVGQCVRVCVCM